MGRKYLKGSKRTDGDTRVVARVEGGSRPITLRTRMASDTSQATPTIYSYSLPVDTFQTPRAYEEKIGFYREVYRRDPLVGRAIDLHSELPLSKVRLSLPDGPDAETNRFVFNIYKNMCDRIRIFERLLSLTHEYNLTGDGHLFLEDDIDNLNDPFPVSMDEAQELLDVMSEEDVITQRGKVTLQIKELNFDYKGWMNAIVIPSENVRIHRFTFSDEIVAEFVPDEVMKRVIKDESVNDIKDEEQLEKVRNSIPGEIQMLVEGDDTIYLDTDPMEGSFLINMSRSLGPELTHGVSMLERCIDVLIYRDKLRQAQSAIASRNMTPKRLVWAENLSHEDVEDLRDQVDMAQETPDYSVVTNYEVHWEEIGGQDRLLELSGEYEITDKLIMYGLGITPDLLTGESTYAGNRVSLEIMNNHYLLFRELIQYVVEEKIFKPFALKKGFFIKDEFGLVKLLYPKLSFTRLAVRDAAETFEHMMALYLKGSLPVDYIYDLLNIPKEDATNKLVEDLFTPKDPKFNQMLDSVYQDIGSQLLEKTDVLNQIIEHLDLKKVSVSASSTEDSFGL